MGVDKATLVVSGRPLAAIAGAALGEAGAAEVLAVGGDPAAAAAVGLEHVADRWPGEGPLGALVTVLDHAVHDVVVVLACDMPRVTRSAVVEVLFGLDATVDAAVADAGDRLHPLLGAYRRSSLHPLRAAFEGGERSMTGALARIRVAAVPLSRPAWAFNANTPDDLRGSG